MLVSGGTWHVAFRIHGTHPPDQLPKNLDLKRATSACNSSITRCIRRNSASTFTEDGAETLVAAASAVSDSNRASAATKLAIYSAR